MTSSITKAQSDKRIIQLTGRKLDDSVATISFERIPDVTRMLEMFLTNRSNSNLPIDEKGLLYFDFRIQKREYRIRIGTRSRSDVKNSSELKEFIKSTAEECLRIDGQTSMDRLLR